MTICVQPSEASHSDRSSNALVVVPTVRTARPTVPFAVTRRHATTMSLCTSRPAQCEYKTSMSHLQARRRLGTPVEGTLENALQGRERPLAQSGVLRDPRS